MYGKEYDLYMHFANELQGNSKKEEESTEMYGGC